MMLLVAEITSLSAKVTGIWTQTAALHTTSNRLSDFFAEFRYSFWTDKRVNTTGSGNLNKVL
jgi:hypothetical protein